MTGSDVSASNNLPERILLVAPNWLGDGIMAMPAVQELRRQSPPGLRLDVLARGGQIALWEMHPDIDRVWKAPTKASEQKALRKTIQAQGFSRAVILPNSFRSAWMIFRTGIHQRRGTVTQFGRKTLITDPVSLAEQQGRHQQWEIARLVLGDPLPNTLPPPRLTPPEAALASLHKRLRVLPRPWLGVLPGAARGPSKQWRGDRFQSVAASWISKTGGSCIWLGTPDDVPLCEELSDSLGDHSTVLAGETTLPEFAAALSAVDVVVGNDSGGMHLATAMDTPVVAAFGITDPEKTGPLSSRATVIQHSKVRNRSIPRESEEARTALDAISAEEVLEAILAFHPGVNKES